MFFLWKRYSRSGYAPPLFYVIMAIGFVGVMSGPLVRSSYRAGRLYRDAIATGVTG